MTSFTALEQHFTCKELAKTWGVSANTVREWVEHREDVLRFGSEHRSRKRRYVSIRVPESVAVKIHAEHCGR